MLLPDRTARTGPRRGRQVLGSVRTAGQPAPRQDPADHRRSAGTSTRTRERTAGGHRPSGASPIRSRAETNSTGQRLPSRGHARRTSGPPRQSPGGSPSCRGSRTGRSCRRRTRTRRPSPVPPGRTAGDGSSWFARPPRAGPTPNRPRPDRPVRWWFAARTAATTPTAGSPDAAACDRGRPTSHRPAPGDPGHRTRRAPRAAPSPADDHQQPSHQRCRSGGHQRRYRPAEHPANGRTGAASAPG